MLFNIIDNHKYDNSKLIEFSISSSGDMLGSYESRCLKYENDKLIYQTKYAKQHNDPIVTMTYNVLNGSLEDIKEIMKKGNLYGVSKKKLSPFVVLDGATTSYRFEFEPYDSFSISSNQDYNKKDASYLNELSNYLNNLVLDEGIRKVDPKEIGLLFNGYRLNYISENIDHDKDNILANITDAIVNKTDKYLYFETNLDIDEDDYDMINEIKNLSIVYTLDKSIRVYYDEDYIEAGAYLLAYIDYYSQSSIDLIKNFEEGNKIFINY